LYPSPRRKRQGSLTPLSLLLPAEPASLGSGGGAGGRRPPLNRLAEFPARRAGKKIKGSPQANSLRRRTPLPLAAAARGTRAGAGEGGIGGGFLGNRCRI